ncbi:unnamed protein product, partial [Meganyctiphanes norvegica]
MTIKKIPMFGQKMFNTSRLIIQHKFHISQYFRKPVSRICNRLCSSSLEIRSSHSLVGEPCNERSIIKVEGKEASPFLQGLVTNDMNHLEDGAVSMYSFILNTQGRVLFDVVIYKKNDETFLLECDGKVSNSLAKHLKIYKVRRKLKIDCVDDDYQTWSIFEPEIDEKSITEVDMESLYINPKAESESVLSITGDVEDTIITRDPRMKYLGHRLILPKSKTVTDVISDVQPSTDGLYRVLRYKLGVGEGSTEIPTTKCLPLEGNCDYLHGVSFHKGCYIGQELTARTFHTGVVRKRYMPLIFKGDISNIEYDAIVTNEKGKSVGKIRAFEGSVGIGLMRIAECLKAQNLLVKGSDISLTTFKPAWWPIEASKERMN